MMNKRETGFTLIELMVVLVIIAILTAIAYPGYQEYILRSRRVDCEAVLMETTGILERRHSAENSYRKSGVAGNGNDNLPDGATCPAEGGTKTYNVVISNVETNTYLLTATPVGQQTKDKCGTLTLNALGVKGAKGVTAEAGASDTDKETVYQCWSR